MKESIEYMRSQDHLSLYGIIHAIVTGDSSSDLFNSHASKTGVNLRYANTQSIKRLKVLSIDNIDTYNGKATYIPDYDRVFAGCWAGTLEEFLKKGLEMNKDNEKELKNIKLAYEFFKNNCV